MGCYSSGPYAPVRNLTAAKKTSTNDYVVKAGDTVYSIAWMYGVDYRDLARINRLAAGYLIHPGQVLHLRKSHVQAVNSVKISDDKKYLYNRLRSNRRRHNSITANEKSASHVMPRRVNAWRWPARGKISQRFEQGVAGNKGINIAGRSGAAVMAAAAGIVVYAGDGVRGYGNLIIIKHTANYLSAYAYNSKLLVHLGDKVSVGQKIALMGYDSAGNAMLHFEIRYNGQPINPLKKLR